MLSTALWDGYLRYYFLASCPDMKELPLLLDKAGYKLSETKVSQEFFFGMFVGGKLGEVEASLRVSGELCNVGVIVGLLDAVPDRARYGLLSQLLELNFDHPLPISILSVPR